MIDNIKVNQNWVIHNIQNESENIFNTNQLELFSSCFNEESINIIHNIIEKKVSSLKINDIVHLDIPSFQLLIIKESAKVLIAVSAAEGSPSHSSKGKESSEEETHFIARSPKMNEVMDVVKKVSFVDSTILLLGKSGVGKSMIAKLIHKYSSRSNKNFISVNCGAIPESLMEAEFFGYTHGSFTGGQKGGKKGIFESANGGIVFLDEVGELPINLQVKLLEVLQENCIRPIGSTKTIPIDVRVVAATNQNLLELVHQKKFREDLYYRLNVVPIDIPPLEERAEDIIYLARYFLKQKINKYGIFKSFHPEVEKVFKQYNWPGNVRELENVIERLIITTKENEIQLKHLPSFFHSLSREQIAIDEGNSIVPLKEAKKMVEKELITKAYDLYKSTYKAAEALGVDQSTIAKKLKQFRKEGR